MTAAWLFFLAGGLLMVKKGHALDVRPFDAANMSPLAQIHGLPRFIDAEIISREHIDVHLDLNIASNYSTGAVGTEAIILDGETYRYDMTVRRGVGGRWEAGVTLPFIRHSGGRFDGFIESWHDLFGITQGGRLEAPRDRLLYRYKNGGRALVDLHEARSGIGDAVIFGGYRLQDADNHKKQTALRFQFKAPTGDEDYLLGSGGTDLAFHLQRRNSAALEGMSLTWYGGGGVLFLTDGDVLPGQQRNVVVFGTLGIGWQPYESILFKVQFDGHTPFYTDSALKQLSTSAIQVTMGGSIGFGNEYVLDIGVVEDIVLDTVSDVTFHFNLRKQF